MSTTNTTGRLARAAARRPRVTLAVWLVLLVAALAAAGTMGGNVTPAQMNLVTTEADRAEDLHQDVRVLADETRSSEQIIVSSDVYTYGQPEFDAVVANAVAALQQVDSVGDVQLPAGPSSVASNGRAVTVSFTIADDPGLLGEARDAIAGAATDDVEAFIFGMDSVTLALNELAIESLARGEGIGVTVALVVLVLVFGALLVAGVPLVMALVSIAVATGIGAAAATVLWNNGVQVSDSLTIFAGMMGLALGIDYSLLTVQRFREELGRGRDVLDAIEVTGATANRAVLLSGGTVVISIGGLLFLPLNMFLGIGIAIIAVAFTSVAAALTLLPALLALLGHRVNKWRLPMRHPGGESRFWNGVARRVTENPARSAAAGVGVLLLLSAPLLSLRLGPPNAEDWPSDFPLHRANRVFTEDFGWTDSTTMIALEQASDAPDAVAALASALEADPDFGGVALEWHGETAFIDMHDAAAGGSEGAERAIDRLRDEIIPSALDGTVVTAHVGGSRAYQMDELQLIKDVTPLAVGFIVLATFVLLLVMFRSVVVPIKAILMNVIGTAATFGVLVAVFQWGWGDAIGLTTVDNISAYMPVMIFALVFGLSMDYHVFLLSRIRERYDATGDTSGAIVEGLARTGPLITGAALIMIGVFGGFAAASIPELAQWGFGLAAGVLIDATIIRVLLVPAAMRWMGDANWYLPRWLGWLPHIDHGASASSVDASPTDSESLPEPALA